MDWNKETIKQFRKDLRLTQKAFTEMLGVTTRYIVYLEAGERKPSKLFLNFLSCLYEKHQNKGG